MVPWPSSRALSSGDRVMVEVRSHGSDGDITAWTQLEIEAGLLNPAAWSAAPITCEAQPIDQPRRPFRTAASFEAPARLSSARLYITALGLYEAHINGVRIGDEYLAPGWTSYHHRLVYRTFDVTDKVAPGKLNVLGSWVGEGWYTGRLAFRGGVRNNYGQRPALIAQLVIDGKIVLSTDATWKWSYGPLLTSELLNGEVYDTRLADGAWCMPEKFSSVAWSPVKVLEMPSTSLESTQAPPVRVIEEITPVDIITTPSGKVVVDFGQNFAGIVRILGEPPTISDELTLRHAEVLEHGELGTRPLRLAAATDRIILGGGKVSGYEPKFTSHGFRYVEVTGWPGITTADLVGLVTHTAMERTGHFSCSHPLLNRLHKNVVYSTISNTISVPTDCPQRDERLGWTGDVQVFAPTINFLFDTSGFLRGWLRDLYFDQVKLEGNVPVTIPDILDAFHNQRLAIWGDVSVITPYDVFVSSADVDILRDQHASAALWLEKGVVRNPETGLWDPDQLQLGDWLAPKAPPDAPGDAPTDPVLVADAYLVHTTRIMSRISEQIGKGDEARKYAQQADSMLACFYAEYITSKGRVMSDTQTALALLIQFGLYPDSNPELLRSFSARLAQLVERDNWKVATGFAGTPIILHALERADQLHHAYRMLQSRDCPSWLSPVLLGATTVWERWDSMLGDGSINPGEMTSFNHYALGSVASFLHSVVGGLSPASPGWQEVYVRPRPGGTITSARTSFLSPYGKVECAWEIVGDRLEVDVQIPPNAQARIELPGLSKRVGSGRRHFSGPWSKDTRFPPKGKEIAYGPLPSDNWAP
jgi:alpha-L-rhamnosidase